MPKIFSIITIIFFCLMFLHGLCNAINPRIIWQAFESWKATKEPINTFFVSRRITGVVEMIIVLGLVGFVLFLANTKR